jgi:hypothetical protein
MKHWTVRSVRFSASEPARLEAAGIACDVVIKDIAEGFRGVGVESARPVELFPGSKARLHLMHEGRAVVMNCLVRWSTGGTHLGLQVRSVQHEQLPVRAQGTVEPKRSHPEKTDVAQINPDTDHKPGDSFVIGIDPVAGEITCRHLASDGREDFQIRSASVEEVLAAVLKPEWVADIRSAARLGGELAKAETCLRAGIPYTQGHFIYLKT